MELIIKDRAIRLFTFLRELSEMRTKTTRSYEQYEQILWLSGIPLEKGCHTYIWEGNVSVGKDCWVEINKPRPMVPPPAIPPSLQDWVILKEYNDSSLERPGLLTKRIIEEDTDSVDPLGDVTKTAKVTFLEDFPELSRQWESVHVPKWQAWAADNRIQKQIHKAYTELYAMYQYQQRMGESYEVVLGLGLLSWKTPSGQTVKRHLLTAQTQITFDPKVGRISVGPGAEGPKLTLEQDMLEPGERPDAAETTLIEGLIDGLDEEITNQDGVDTILRSWINSLPNSLGYEQEIAPSISAETAPKIIFAPALVLRKRTERSLVRAFKEIIEQLKGAETLPDGVDVLVADPDEQENRNEGGVETDNPFPGMQRLSSSGEVLFPLLANDEQIHIATMLEHRKGILVQGPPGTGKSHTIANLICHLLANGKRVLVTSHTSRALVVLREKIPKEIAPLCVIALSDDMKSMKALEESVNGITDKHNSWNSAQNDETIKRLEKDTDTAKREEARALADLKAIREAETYKHSEKFGTYSGTLKVIAERLRVEEPKFEWLGIRPSETVEPPLSTADFLELLSLLRQFDPEYEIEISQYIPSDNELMSANDFSALVNEEQSAKLKYATFAEFTSHKDFSALAGASGTDREKLTKALERFVAKVEHLSDEAYPWAKEAVYQVLAGQHCPLLELQELTVSRLDQVTELLGTSAELQVSGLEGRDRKTVEVQANALLDHLERKGRLGFWKLRPQVVTDALFLIEGTRVSGSLCANITTLKLLLDWLKLNENLEALGKAWAGYQSQPSNMVPQVQRAEFESRLACLGRCLSVEDELTEAKAAVLAIQGLSEPTWHNIDRAKTMMKVIAAAESSIALKDCTHRVDDFVLRLENDCSHRSDVHPVVKELVNAVKERATMNYGTTLQKVQELGGRKIRLERKKELLDALYPVAEPLAAALLADPANEAWDERIKEFTEAWNWARADRWIRRMSNPEELEQLSQQVNGLRLKIQRYYAELAAAKAWSYCLNRLTDRESGHLRAWQLAVKRIGRGSSKRVNEYRREARAHLEGCRTAIPAWIMPIYRVAETIEMKPDIFDVVIVDEASQSGPEALFLQYIAKKIVVVGDSKQISPTVIGINKDEVALLRQKLIKDIPYNDALGIEHSFFDQAFIRYKGQVCLREHFRCMPEIIQFSNNLCYSTTPLVPLKQFGANRLTPTVQTFHIPEGYQKGRSSKVTNPPEAEAVVSFIANCCADKCYDGKKFGVISLLGDEQGKLIYSMLIDRIGPAEIEKREIVCGDAYSFQGDERDVMVLSMVSAPGERRIGTLVDADSEKRFNVAASRAKEQMILFHSATLEDLSPECLRHRLLKYCMNPGVEPAGVPGHDISSLIHLAYTSRRDIVSPPVPFDSWFELDVFLDISARGYRVIPQLEVAGYRIDLVVEGLRGRLAVECDGDQWHGPDQYDRDMARQRQLERSGYVFWRVRGSSYYRDPKASMESLWETLRRMQIVPTAEEETVSPQPVAEQAKLGESNKPRVWQPSTSSVNISRKPEALVPEKINIFVENRQEKLDIFDVEPGDSSRRLAQEEFECEISCCKSQDDEKADEDNEELAIIEESRLSHMQVNVKLDVEYRNWAPKPLPDPSSSPVAHIAVGLVEIAKVEGPIVCHRAYSIYANACGIRRVGRQLRSNFNKAVNNAVNEGLLVIENEHNIVDQIHKIIRVPACPLTLLRPRGDRSLEEIPPYEIVMMIKRIIDAQPYLVEDSESLFRTVLSQYELVRMTSNARGILQKAYDRYKENAKKGDK